MVAVQDSWPIRYFYGSGELGPAIDGFRWEQELRKALRDSYKFCPSLLLASHSLLNRDC